MGQVPFFYGRRNTGRPASEDKSKDTVRYLDLPITPLFPFGHGLSYTEFAYRNLSISPARAGDGAVIKVSFQLSNTGKRAGDEVVQLYVRDPVASVAQPLQKLVGFERLALTAGDRVKVTFELPIGMLGLFDQDMNCVVEPGEIEVMVGSSSADIRLRGTLQVSEELRDQGDPGSLFSRVTTEQGS